MAQAQRAATRHADEAPHPPIVSRNEWLKARKTLLTHEKDLTRHYDTVNAERRRLPMVRIEKNYTFEGPRGTEDLKALFDGRRQLVVYHFMFDPDWKKGCPACTAYVDALGSVDQLHQKDTNFALISRAPY